MAFKEKNIKQLKTENISYKLQTSQNILKTFIKYKK